MTGAIRIWPFHERQVVTGGVLDATLTEFGLSLLGWGGQSAWHQYQSGDDPEMEAAE